jgi:phage terminase large subunit-like protein
MDTDGTCERAAPPATSISLQLAEDVAFLARSFGAKCFIKSRGTSYTHNGEKREGRRSYTVTIRLPHIPLFRLDRKQTRYIRPTSTTDHHVVETFSDAPPGEIICIAVDSPDNTYVVEGFIVTHNTYCAGAECSYHLTGNYPPWWQGRRFNDPVAGWAIGVSSELTRDSCQRILFGRASSPGTGLVPRRLIRGTTSARGVSEALDTVTVEHVSGGNSTIGFKSYQQDREKLQAETLHFVWMDEEPPYDIYSEAVTRTNATNGIILLTFTPLEGMSDVVRLFYPKPTTPDRALVQMTLEDAAHFSEEQRNRVKAFYKPHEREARTRGIPQLGSGKVFAIPESAYCIDAFSIPRHWPKIIGIDLGFDHPFGAVLLAHDRESDTVHHPGDLRGPADRTQHALICGAGAAEYPWHGRTTPPPTIGPLATRWPRSTAATAFRCSSTAPSPRVATASNPIADMIDRLESGR